jgi:4-hydroxythreonine-4-phosphate dehydrogenase
MPDTSTPFAQSSQPPKAVCLTIGDPTGIGPEITAKFLQTLSLGELSHPLWVIGDVPELFRQAEALQITLPEASTQVRYVDIQSPSGEALPKTPGQIAYDSLQTAVQAIHANEASILVTGPISKENLQAADIEFSGHTEILQHLARQAYQKPYQSDMLFLYQNFRMLLLTRHVALKKVSEALSIRGVSQSLGNLAHFLKAQCRIAQPNLCILGVNPHAGELDGDEEERILKPALRQVSEKYAFPIEAPIAADAAFRHFNLQKLPYDAYVAAYHDQGLIPFKMVAGLEAVNVTIGLPFLRTSVSHGTAPDIVGQGIADPISLITAYWTALSLLSPASPIRDFHALSIE